MKIFFKGEGERMEEMIQPTRSSCIFVGPIQVHWYGVIIGVAIALALYIAIRESIKRGLA